MIQKAAATADRKLINRRCQDAMAPNGSDVSAVRGELESVGHRRAIDYFRRKCGRPVTAYVSQTLGPHVTRLQSQTAAAAMVQLRLLPLIVDVALIFRR